MNLLCSFIRRGVDRPNPMVLCQCSVAPCSNGDHMVPGEATHLHVRYTQPTELSIWPPLDLFYQQSGIFSPSWPLLPWPDPSCRTGRKCWCLRKCLVGVLGPFTYLQKPNPSIPGMNSHSPLSDSASHPASLSLCNG